MKAVIFAHTPPPFHGQSYMVEQLLQGLGGDQRPRSRSRANNLLAPESIECFHVNARFSDEMGKIGTFSLVKALRLVKYCLEAVWCRFRYGAEVFYYIPAPPKRVALYRDFLVLLVCRPFFRRVVWHWEASGLGTWIQQNAAGWERSLARWLLGSPDLSIVLANSLSEDATYLSSKNVRVIPNGIPDPAPDFATLTLPVRSERLRRRKEAMLLGEGVAQHEIYRVLYLAHCTREKGLFDALEAIVLANQELAAQELKIQLHLTVAGAFLRESEREEFVTRQMEHPTEINYAGFVGREAKRMLLSESDCLCFPSYYPAEAQPVSIVEAMALGLTVVAAAWRGIPELLPQGYPFLLPDHSPLTIAHGLIASMQADLAKELRQRYEERFTAARYVASFREALGSITKKYS